MSYIPSLIVIPHRILYLEGVTLSFIKVYEIVFHLWQSDKPCFIGNEEFCKRTGLAESTIREAIAYFESKGEWKRQQRGRRRYLIQTIRMIEISTESKKNDGAEIAANRVNNTQGAEVAAATRCQIGGLPAEVAAHNILNINNTNLIERESNDKNMIKEPLSHFSNDLIKKETKEFIENKTGLSIEYLEAEHIKFKNYYLNHQRNDWEQLWIRWMLNAMQHNMRRKK